MTEERPDALLKSALEKIIYFEARSEQLGNDLVSARTEADRLRGELALAAQREIELRRLLAEHEVQIRRGHQHREELASVIDALKAERAELIGKLIEASRIHSSGGEEDAPFDLASFIAQLRSEALAVKPHHQPPMAQPLSEMSPRVEAAKAKLLGGPSPGASPPTKSAQRSAYAQLGARPSRPPPSLPPSASPLPVIATAPQRAVAVERVDEEEPALPSATTQHAERLMAEGRLSVSTAQLEELAQKVPDLGRTEETLFGFSVRELAGPDAQARSRAAERLKVLGLPAAASPLASALMAEHDPHVLVSLLSAFAALAKREGAAIVTRHLEAPVAEVRIAALKSLLVLDPGQAAPYLSAAMKDPEPSVRRRASLLALGLSPDSALALGEQALADADPEVRRLGALALGATAGEKARTLLIEAVNDSEAKVRKVAAQSLSRLLGQDISGLVNLDEAQRRREVRKLLAAPTRPSSPLPQMPAAALGHPTRAATMGARPEPRAEPARPAGEVAKAPMDAGVGEPLCAQLLAEVRCALRGRTLPELCNVTANASLAVESACELLVARGQLIRRGKKYCAA